MVLRSRNSGLGPRWLLPVLLILLPLWLVGLFDRGFWTPDEPREADIVWRMSWQPDKTLPQLAGMPFLEKPPLSYWMSAASISVFGDSPAAARLPNLLYAALTALAVGALTLSMTGRPLSALVAALVASTAITSFRVAVWLAPDACLLAGCGLSLLGAYRGFRAPPGKAKLLWYSLMHIGAVIGFMAKSAPGWLVPALALLAVIVWERRWTELRRWELYAGFVLQAVVIGSWIVSVARTAHGGDALAALFWHNIVGRFTKISAPAALDYTVGHRNSPGKYLLELPVYLLPWTLLAVAALRRAWNRVRASGPDGTAWRFAVGATLPFLALLSVAATARDIYAAPVLLGFGILIGLWAAEAAREPNVLDALALRGTRVLIAIIAGLFALVLLVLAAAAAPGMPGGAGGTGGATIYVVTAIAVVAAALGALWFGVQAQRRGNLHTSFTWTCSAHVAAVCLTALAMFPTVDQWQNLPSIARQIHDDTRQASLALLSPDETTIAMLDRDLLTPFTALTTESVAPRELVSDWLNAHGDNARVLVLLPGHAPGDVSRVLERFHAARDPGDGVAATLVSDGIASIVARYELPQGRRYALLGPPGCRSRQRC